MNGILLNQGGAGAVESVNGQIGDVVLLAEDVGAVRSVNGKEGNDIILESSDLYAGLVINDDKFQYQSETNEYNVYTVDSNGLTVSGTSLNNTDINLDVMVFDDNLIPVGTQTHKLSEKANQSYVKELETRIATLEERVAVLEGN